MPASNCGASVEVEAVARAEGEGDEEAERGKDDDDDDDDDNGARSGTREGATVRRMVSRVLTRS